MDEPISQRYQIRQELGKGGFSTVYIAWDALLSREVALKVLKTSGGDHEELVQRFLTEARITSKLNHPNTLTIFDFGKSPDGRCFLVSELLKGESLFDFLLQGAVPPEFGLQIIYQMGLERNHHHHDTPWDQTRMRGCLLPCLGCLRMTHNHKLIIFIK